MASQEVVLELNNIEEEEELEELEDGRCPVGAEDVDNSPPPFQEDEPIHNHPRQKWVEHSRNVSSCYLSVVCTCRYKRGILPVSPYCDCEPLKCHLLPAKRPHPQIRLGQVKGVCELAISHGCHDGLNLLSLSRVRRVTWNPHTGGQ